MLLIGKQKYILSNGKPHQSSCEWHRRCRWQCFCRSTQECFRCIVRVSLIDFHCVFVIRPYGSIPLKLLMSFVSLRFYRWLCREVCAGPWDVVCFIEHLCVANLVKFSLIVGLCYISNAPTKHDHSFNSANYFRAFLCCMSCTFSFEF